ncbi:MAG: DNA recombination protein RmuC [Oscillospiraceae bacterium]|jgi:DNA recombination protein RmuC
MNLELYLSICSLILSAASIAVMTAVLVKLEKSDRSGRIDSLEKEIKDQGMRTQEAVNGSVRSMAYVLKQSQDSFGNSVNESLKSMDDRLSSFIMLSRREQEDLRNTTERHLAEMRENSDRQLEVIRTTVDDKLQKTLDARLSQGFSVVSQRLEQVYKGLGEMQTMAQDVGDLKKVLTNVKTRGIVGEIQLGSILEQTLSRDQYEENVVTKHGSTERVEYAVKIPVNGGKTMLLPIDAKFPLDAYTNLQNAIEGGSREEMTAAYKTLTARIKSFAKDISDKYIDPPYTTDFGIMFLPVEGLYAEVVEKDLLEELQSKYRVMIAGPTTMTALLNSLQMGFRALTIQQRTNEVWQVLLSVKTEFDKFGDTLSRTQRKLDEANRELDSLVGKRTRAIQRKLKGISETGSGDPHDMLSGDSAGGSWNPESDEEE